MGLRVSGGGRELVCWLPAGVLAVAGAGADAWLVPQFYCVCNGSRMCNCPVQLLRHSQPRVRGQVPDHGQVVLQRPRDRHRLLHHHTPGQGEGRVGGCCTRWPCIVNDAALLLRALP